MVNVSSGPLSSQVHKEGPIDKAYLTFVSIGFVSLTEQGEKVPVEILRDVAALSSFVLVSVFPFSEMADTRCSDIVRRIDYCVCFSAQTACFFRFGTGV